MFALLGGTTGIGAQGIVGADQGISLEQLVLDNAIDIGLIETQPEHPDLQAAAFLEDELGAIVPPGSALAQKTSVTLPELAKQPFLMREPGSSGRKILDAAFALHHLSVSPVWESVSTQAIIQAVSQGLGVAVLPKLLVERDVQDGAVAMLPFDVPLRRTLYIVHHRQKFLSSNMQRFVALCQTAKLPNIG